MIDLWKRLRRLGTSIMLAAALAFAFHNAAVAADISGAIGCNGDVHAIATPDHIAAHEHAGVAHSHTSVAHSHDHQHASTDHQKIDGTPHSGDCKVPCCGSACTIALLVAPAMPQIVRGRPASVLATQSQAIHEAQPSGLKRPPRPLLTV
jgi:hypothetical protein